MAGTSPGHNRSIGEEQSCLNPPIGVNSLELSSCALRFIPGREERKAGRAAAGKSCEMGALASPERGKNLADDRRQAQRGRLKVVAARRGMVEEPVEAPP